MKISAHVSHKEVTFSNTAIKNGIDNNPNAEQLANIQRLCERIFEPLREWVGGAIKINSCFRSDELNKRIGGANGSQHLANNGSAALDLDDTFGHKTNAEMFHWIRENVVFDQLIWEFGDENNPDWVHVSLKEEGNRKEILQAIRVNGRTSYVIWEEKLMS